ncbi:Glutathionylspermidine synthase OS=Lysinibacillus sphaericus OX=1421 GN=LS41612_15090 PE=4 SV=1 [Lysinibacillus sphaericus]
MSCIVQTFPRLENVNSSTEDEAQNKIGLWLLELVEQNLLTIINPPFCFFTTKQSGTSCHLGLARGRK